MVFRNFRLQVVLRVGLICLCTIALAFMLTNTHLRVTPFVCGALLLICVFNLIHYVESTNRTFTAFLNSIYYQDFATKVSTRELGASFRHLSAAYQLITDSFRRITYQKEEHLNLLEAVVDRLQVAIICADDAGRIKLFNKAAKTLFKTPHIHHLKRLEQIDAFVYQCTQKLMPGEQQLVSANINSCPVSLSVLNSTFRTGNKQYRLFSFHNIRDELEQKEGEAWQKLIRVLAHEIMNSATPILSLSASIKGLISSGDGGIGSETGVSLQDLSEDDQRDLLRSLDSIESRSKGLIHFVDAYRGLTQIPEPKPALTDVSQLIQNVTQSLMPEIVDGRVKLETRFEKEALTVKVDCQQVEQVLINLLRNALQALEARKNPRIEIEMARTSYNKVVVDIIDNGCGIAKDNLANIFMPFYTTKPKGTGVGLSISRQIMFMNRGLLTAESKEGEGSRFRLEFSA